MLVLNTPRARPPADWHIVIRHGGEEVRVYFLGIDNDRTSVHAQRIRLGFDGSRAFEIERSWAGGDVREAET